MSLKFNWNFFDVKDLQKRLQAAITESIALAPRPPSIAEPIRATKLFFGTKPPDLSFESVLSVSLSRTHICFSLKYDGDASLTLETAVQGNPLREPLSDPAFPTFVRPQIAGCFDSLVIPFRLVLKNIVLDSMIDVVYTPNGVVIHFREDPIKHIETESSLDMIPGVKQMIGQMLMEQLSCSFKEDIPETVWASTSPKKIPPDPFFGITRWSQFRRQEIRFSAISLSSTASEKAALYEPKRTLALYLQKPLLSFPNAILGPFYASQFHNSTPSQSEYETDADSPLRGLKPRSSPQRITRVRSRRRSSSTSTRNFNSDSWKQFVQEPSLASETASIDTQSSTKWNPRRRVIKLRQLSQSQQKKPEIPASATSPPAVPMPPSPPSPPSTPALGASTTTTSGRSSPTVVDIDSMPAPGSQEESIGQYGNANEFCRKDHQELEFAKTRTQSDDTRRYSSPAHLATNPDLKELKRAKRLHRIHSTPFLAAVHDVNDH